MPAHELLAALLSISAVWLTTRRNPWCYPVGLASVCVYLWVYWQARLYSEVLLQLFWIGMLITGWRRWQQHLDASGHVQVAALPRAAALRHLLTGISGGLLLGAIMHRYTDAALPWLDALLTALSLVGQFWQNRRHTAAWWMWIAVDTAYVGMFLVKQLYITAALYAGFIVLAILGLRAWTRAQAEAMATDR